MENKESFRNAEKLFRKLDEKIETVTSFFQRIRRNIGNIPPPLIDRKTAIKIAKHVAKTLKVRGRHIGIQEGLKTWRINLRPSFKPGYYIFIDNQTGKVTIPDRKGLR